MSPAQRTARTAALTTCAAASFAAVAAAQSAPAPADPGRLTIERIFASGELRPAGAPGLQWLADGRSYAELRGGDLVRVDAASGAATVLVPAAALVDERGQRIAVEEFALSPDARRALLFHRSVRVWRSNTRGTFHVVDFASRRVTPIAASATSAGSAASAAGGAADTVPGQALGQRTTGVPGFIGRGLASGAVDADLQMFAKFSPTRAASPTCAPTTCGSPTSRPAARRA
jgi:dipeptidyl-peptidase-4